MLTITEPGFHSKENAQMDGDLPTIIMMVERLYNGANQRNTKSAKQPENDTAVVLYIILKSGN